MLTLHVKRKIIILCETIAAREVENSRSGD